MLALKSRTIIVDTCVWFALFDRTDQNFGNTEEKAEYIEEFRIILPWPVLYETLGTRFVKNQNGMDRFEQLLKRKDRVELLDDRPYRDDALEATFQSARRGRPISFCDMVIRLMIENINVRVGGVLTFNTKDFVDVCRNRNVPII